MKGQGKLYITVSEWLSQQGFQLSHGEKIRFSAIASRLYKNALGETPKRINRKTPSSGLYSNRSYGYLKTSELHFLEQAWEEYLMSAMLTC